MTISGKGYEILIEEVFKNEIPDINNYVINKKKFYPHKVAFSIKGFDFQRYSLIDDSFKDKGIIEQIPSIYLPVFEDKIYLISLYEIVGDIMIFSPLKKDYDLQCYYIYPFKKLICYQLYKEEIPFESSYTICSSSQYLYYKRAGIFIKHKLIEN